MAKSLELVTSFCLCSQKGIVKSQGPNHLLSRWLGPLWFGKIGLKWQLHDFKPFKPKQKSSLAWNECNQVLVERISKRKNTVIKISNSCICHHAMQSISSNCISSIMKESVGIKCHNHSSSFSQLISLLLLKHLIFVISPPTALWIISGRWTTVSLMAGFGTDFKSQRII